MSVRKGQRWLLFGGAGLVGSHVRNALRDREAIVTTHRTSLPGASPIDLTDRRAVTDLVRRVRPDVIVMAAAEAHVEKCEREPAATAIVNVDAVRVVADAAPRALLVVFSSEYVFDGRRGHYAEEDPVAPINEYGRQKVRVESIARERPEHLICRVSGVYGWSHARTSFVAQLVDRSREGRRFRVPADQLITPTPARDLGEAVVDLVDRQARGTIHAAGPEVLARPEFARRAALAFGLDPSLVEPVPTADLGLAAPRPLRAGLSTARLRALLGRELSPSAEGLAAMRATEPR